MTHRSIKRRFIDDYYISLLKSFIKLNCHNVIDKKEKPNKSMGGVDIITNYYSPHYLLLLLLLLLNKIKYNYLSVAQSRIKFCIQLSLVCVCACVCVCLCVFVCACVCVSVLCACVCVFCSGYMPLKP